MADTERMDIKELERAEIIAFTRDTISQLNNLIDRLERYTTTHEETIEPCDDPPEREGLQ